MMINMQICMYFYFGEIKQHPGVELRPTGTGTSASGAYLRAYMS
jgi:hypothetical protein